MSSPPAAELPRLSRETSASITPGIVHLGIGAFHRGHQAWYTHNAMAVEQGDWHIVGVSLRSASVAAQLNPQQGLYTLVEQDEQGVSASTITSITNVLVAPESPEAVLQQLCEPNISVVSLTITEKGYCHLPATGELNLAHPDIQHDLASPAAPKTSIGLLAYAMQYRIDNGLPPFTALSCDNLPANGELLRKLVLTFAKHVSDELSESIDKTYTFPCSMVDRIVPAMTEESRQAFCAELGYDDKGLIATEPFSQWVIEDNFANGRPAWDQVGALIVKNVHAYETMKLQLLNGSHSAIAYIGSLSGLETVSDAIGHGPMRQFIHDLMRNELMPSLAIPGEIDVHDYCEQLLKRFANVKLHHKTAQIAMDGSQKIPQRWLKPLQHQLAEGLCIERLCFALASWIHYVSGSDLVGQPIDVQDPMSERLAACHDDDIGTWLKSILMVDELFSQDTGNNMRLQDTLEHWLTRLQQSDSAVTLLDEVEKRADSE